jgi:hypothetical protein
VLLSIDAHEAATDLQKKSSCKEYPTISTDLLKPDFAYKAKLNRVASDYAHAPRHASQLSRPYANKETK